MFPLFFFFFSFLKSGEQDFGYYGGGGGQGSRMYKNPQRTSSGGSDFFAESLMPPANSRSSIQRKNGEDQEPASEFSPGLLDLHSFDTELLTEVWMLLSFEFRNFDSNVCKRGFCVAILGHY